MSTEIKPNQANGVSSPANDGAGSSTAAATSQAASNGAAPPDPVTLTANQLRALAEAADGSRKVKMFLVASGNSAEPVKIEKGSGATTVLIELLTDEKEKFQNQATIKTDPVLDELYDIDGKLIPGALKDCDAVFTSLSAVEKFLVPYYVKLKTLDEVKKMRDAFANSTVTVAAFHLPSSYPGFAREGGIVFAKEKNSKLTAMPFAEFVK